MKSEGQMKADCLYGYTGFALFVTAHVTTALSKKMCFKSLKILNIIFPTYILLGTDCDFYLPFGVMVFVVGGFSASVPIQIKA